MVINEKRSYPTSVGLTVLSEFQKIRLREEGDYCAYLGSQENLFHTHQIPFYFALSLKERHSLLFRIDELEIDEELSRKE